MADVFLQWRARKVMAKLGRKWRSCCGLSLRAVEAKEMQMELTTRSGRHWLSSRAQTRDVEALAEHARHVVISS